MFLTYLRRELRRRMKQAVVVALGLTIGIGLVLTVSSASAGVKTAQADVLHALYGVGTDITVTKAVAPGTRGPQSFGALPRGSTQISQELLRPTGGLSTMPESDVAKVATLHGTAAATGGLELTDTTLSGTMPSYPSSGGYSASGPPSSSSSAPSFSVSSFSVDGVQITKTGVGPLAPSQVTTGRYFTAADDNADVAIVSSSYATQESLKAGSTITVGGKALSIVGIAQLASGAADVYIPLGAAQTLADLSGDVTDIYVSATSASVVSSLASAIGKAIPGSTVTTSASLAAEVSGSLSSASKLATSLGKWLSVAALIVAFVVAGLLMMAAVSRRVREFGTLKAIGWRTRRIVEQVMGEGVVLGVVGGIAGIVLGIVASAVISAVGPTLSATLGPSYATGGAGGFGPAGGFGRGVGHAISGAHTVLVHLTAPLQGGTVGIAVVLAVAGGLVAGAFGSWRAARLRPAAALRRVE
ncbi:MAG TPA: FtsX-like permease family protein [Acidimicrobiales bacterium]|nr:FtsX-like permease family protein [Acidimicrobiales bacterium]